MKAVYKTENSHSKSIVKRNNRLGLLFALPWIIGFICFKLYPTICAFYYSFTDFSIFGSPEFIGLENYVKLIQDDVFFQSIGNTAYMVFLGLPLQLLVALFIALLLNKNLRSRGLFRTAFYIPTVIPLVAASMLFMWLLNSEYGLIGYVFKILGISSPSWLADPKYTKLSLIILDVWRCGQNAIILLAGLQAIPRELYEAASIDGASGIKKFFKITVPSLAPTLEFVLIMGIINSFQYFTQGLMLATYFTDDKNLSLVGPKNSLLFFAIYLYKNAFIYLDMGYASALAVVMLLIIMSISFFAIRAIRERIDYNSN